MEREVLKDILLLQNKTKKEDSIRRSLLKKIKDYKKTPFIIIISGVRRCGKSTLLNQILTKDCYYVNFDDERFINFTVNDFQMLYELLIELFGEKNIFLFDEIQNIKGWERFVRRLHNEKKKIYVTGSNASMLSKELGTHLTGRNIALQLFPFSFKEFLVFKNHKVKDINSLTSIDKSKIKRIFNEYLNKGGFPEFLKTDNEEYLKNLYENILFRDIISRYNLPSEKPIKESVYFAVSNIGKEISFNSIKKLTGLTSATTIKEYFEYLENSYLLFLIPRYDFSLKKQTYYNKKIYCIDNGIAKVIGFKISQDKGRLLENAIFLTLKNRYQEIFFHKQNNECDFLIKKGNKIIQAIQVTYSFTENKEREINGLLEALKKYGLKEGLILTMNDEKRIIKEGKKIIIKPAWKWMLEN